jgi:hypothetical protein
VGLIRRSELDLDLVACVGLGIAEQQIEAPGVRLATLDILDGQVAEAQESRVLCQESLKPLLVVLRVRLQARGLRFLDSMALPLSRG